MNFIFAFVVIERVIPISDAIIRIEKISLSLGRNKKN